MDLRIRQLPSILVADPALAERRRIKEKMQKEGGYAGMSWEDVSFSFFYFIFLAEREEKADVMVMGLD